MNPIKLLALDLDGTLYKTGGTEVSEENVQALERLDRQNILIVPTSGRNACIEDVPEKLRHLNIEYFIGNNGAVINKLKEDKFIYQEKMDFEETLSYTRYLEENKFFVYAIIDGKHYASDLNVNEGLQQEFSGLLEHANLDSPLSEYIFHNHLQPDKIGIIVDNSNLDKVPKALEVKDDYKKITIVQTNYMAVEAYSRNTGKGIALKWLADHLGISRENILAIGDSDSDVSMLEFAGISVAMKNGADSAKAVSDMISNFDNNESGVASVINELLEQYELSDT